MANKEKQPKRKRITSIEGFVRWTNKLEGNQILYRGMANCEWEVESAGFRRVKTKDGDSIVFGNYITDLLDRARKRGYGRRSGVEISDLELLAELQHYGAATCLIDFTANPLVALWFACKGEPEKEEDGKVIAMRTDDTHIFAEVTHEQQMDEKEGKIQNFITEEKILKWEPAHANNRIAAQRSLFIFGKSKIDKQHYKEIAIIKEHKKLILEALRYKYGIAEDTLFMDLSGFALSNAHDRLYESYSSGDYFNLGVVASQRVEYKKSIYYYDKAIELNPNYAEAYNNRGIAKGRSRNIQGSLKDYNKAIELNPQYVDAYNNRGAVKARSRDIQGALEDFNEAIELNPNYAMAYNNRGNAKRESGNIQGALEDYNKAIELNPSYATAYNNRGNAKKESGNIQEALEDYNKAIELNSDNVEAYNNRGVARKELGDMQGALEDYDKAIEINPDDATAYNNRGVARKESGDIQGALEDYEKAIEINPDNAKTYNNRGVAKGESDDIQGALEDCDKAIEINPNYVKAYYNRAIAKQALGDQQGAQEDFQKAHELDPIFIPPTNSPK